VSLSMKANLINSSKYANRIKIGKIDWVIAWMIHGWWFKWCLKRKMKLCGKSFKIQIEVRNIFILEASYDKKR
jgi:hypothetical protein